MHASLSLCSQFVKKATTLVLNKPSAYEASKKQLEGVAKLTKLGFSPAVSAGALLKSKNNVDDAFKLCKETPQSCLKQVGSSKGAAAIKGKMVKKSAGGSKLVDAEDHPYNQDNFVFALMSYLEERLGHYSSYCVSCHAPHSCFNPDGGVVCRS